MKNYKKPTILISILIIFTFIFSGCGKEDTSLTKVRLNEVVHSVFYAPQYVSIEKGFFEEEGLDIELSVGQGADKSMTALISNSADIALLGTEAGIYVYNEGKEDFPKAFAQLTQRAGNFLVSRKEEPNFKWEDLKGKSLIGGRTGGMPQLVLEYVLKNNNIKIGEDLDIINNISFESTAGAFQGDIGDYTVEFEPTATALENSGAGHVVASLGTESGYIPYTVYMATSEYIENNPEIIQKFTNAVYKGQQWVDTHSSKEIAEVIYPHFQESDVETLTKIIERYKSQDTWKTDPLFEEEGLTLIQDIMESGGELDKRVPYDEFVIRDFAEKAMDN
ncbi:MAG: ABC transporter substrate-binding protein [Tyzzerella sp.]|uniref:ABC transporter substrate-binding protein n=1 Tax=Candidatus Fimicola merdigallinarum TaxID=2840819 RepID=A0A9D9H4B2_9FIRM|nr:ABC transporter substrate-binding protein [Candidatus Fimicola merdigallinarum]